MRSPVRHLVMAVVTGCFLASCAGSEPALEDQIVLRFAVLGDAEPKPEPEFPNLEAAVQDLNALASEGRLDFVVGVGDIPHKGTRVQYENATRVLRGLELPFYPIMGNEEHGSTVERFLEHANRWNRGRVRIDSPRYVREHDTVALVHASPDSGRDFDDAGIDWILDRIREVAPKPVLLIVHAARAGAYPENPEKGVENPRFARVLAQPNLSAVISGDLHMHMKRVRHSRRIGSVHHLHIPALERTKIPDETHHDPMFRVFTLLGSGEMQVDTYRVGEREPLEPYVYRFSLRDKDAASHPGFRVRSDMTVPLDADAGWAAPEGASATVLADAPFRLRMEVEGSGEPKRHGLQYRRNHGDWTPVEAHDFPYPLREFGIRFDAAEPGNRPEGWHFVNADGNEVAVEQTGGRSTLRLEATGKDLIALYPPPWSLEEGFSLAGEFRLPALGGGRFGLVFGYVDPSDYWRLLLDARNQRLRVERVIDGTAELLAERAVDVRFDRWLEAEVQLEGNTLEINFDDDALEFVVPLESLPPLSDLGVVVPGGDRAEVRGVSIEGEPSSPRVSIVSTDAYVHRTTTGGLLDQSSLPFVGGFGVNLAPLAPVLDTGQGHAEIEWPLVIRRFADGAAMNETGDLFEFRVTDEDGRPAAGAPAASVALEVPQGHLGGTFVETPGRVGPFQADNGDLYFIMEPAESDNLFMVVKSTDGGQSWHEAGADSRPATGDLEAVDGRLVGDTLHILHQVTESTRYHAFHTADHPSTPDHWAITDEVAAEFTARAQMASLVVRSDGSAVAFHLGDTLRYTIRSPEGEWGESRLLEAEAGDTHLAGPQAVLGADDQVHVAYYRTDGSIHYRRLDPNGSLTEPKELATGLATGEDHWGPVLPLVHLPATDTVVIVYRGRDGHLQERRIRGSDAPTPAVQVSDRVVVQHAVDSQQTGADVIRDRESLYVLFIDAGDRSIYSSRETEDGWTPARLEVDGINGSWVRGGLLRSPGGGRVYGYVYDAGSGGGAGMNRYREWQLPAP